MQFDLGKVQENSNGIRFIRFNDGTDNPCLLTEIKEGGLWLGRVADQSSSVRPSMMLTPDLIFQLSNTLSGYQLTGRLGEIEPA